MQDDPNWNQDVIPRLSQVKVVVLSAVEGAMVGPTSNDLCFSTCAVSSTVLWPTSPCQTLAINGLLKLVPPRCDDGLHWRIR